MIQKISVVTLNNSEGRETWLYCTSLSALNFVCVALPCQQSDTSVVYN